MEELKRLEEIVETAKRENRDLSEQEKIEFDNLEKIIKEKRAKEKEMELRDINFATKDNSTQEFRNIASYMIEAANPSSKFQMRGLTLNGTGAVNLIQTLFTENIEKNELISGYTYNFGESAQTVIPVLSPSPARPSEQTENASSIGVDTAGVLTGKSLILKPFVSILPVSGAVLKFNSNIENQIKNALSKTFGDAIFYNSLVSSSGAFTGIFQDSNATITRTSSATSYTSNEIINFVLSASSVFINPILVVNPAVVSSILSDGNVSEAVKNEIMINKSIYGVKIYSTNYAPHTITANKPIAVIFEQYNYQVGVANEIEIEPIKKVGDVNVYFQAVMYMAGMPAVSSNIYMLKTKTS